MKRYRIIIAGGRDFGEKHVHWDLIFVRCNAILYNLPKDEIEIVSGGAKGADRLGEVYAAVREYPVKVFKANWDKFGKSAGYLRNKEMSEYATHLIAFWDGKSKGTKHMIDLAREKGLKIRVIKY